MGTKSLALIGLFVATTAVLAQISIPLPFSPVPLTGQTFSVFLAGALLRGRQAAFAMIAYMLLGAVGVPVFARGQAGPGVLLGPTGGYLFGFVLGAYVEARILENKGAATYRRLVWAMLTCLLLTYALGALRLVTLLRITPREALAVGVIPYLPLDLLKLLVAAVVAVPVRRAIST